MSAHKGAIALDPNDEFELILMQVVKTHRAKSVQYGSQEDTLANFYDVAHVEDISPLKAAEVLMAKHVARLIKWKRDGMPEPDESVEDAFRDRAVYSIIAWVLFERGEYA